MTSGVRRSVVVVAVVAVEAARNVAKIEIGNESENRIVAVEVVVVDIH